MRINKKKLIKMLEANGITALDLIKALEESKMERPADAYICNTVSLRNRNIDIHFSDKIPSPISFNTAELKVWYGNYSDKDFDEVYGSFRPTLSSASTSVCIAHNKMQDKIIKYLKESF